MSPSRSTQAIDVERPSAGTSNDYGHSQTGDPWSFVSRERLFAPLKPRTSGELGAERSAAANTSGTPTRSPQRTVDVSDLKAVVPRRPFFGKRGFVPLYQWEGVVEEVREDGFRARLVPFNAGRVDVSQVEYADFEYLDLADESDLDLVSEGAVFYWTVGKSRNRAGTYTNTSLVRFRRLPLPSQYQMREARREAERLMSDLDAD